MNDDWNRDFIRKIFINKVRIKKCINVILTREDVVFDAVCMISTYSTYDNDGDERCELDEVVLSKEFPGYPEELSYIKYKDFLS